MKRFKSKQFIAGVVFTLILVSCINVLASGAIRKNIDVLYNDIKLIVDGKPVKFGKDAAGKQIEPFIHNGTTYLPVRAVGEAVGKNVDWDGATQTVYLGEKPGEVSYMTEVIKPYQTNGVAIYSLNSPDKLNMGGKEYKTGYIMKRTYSNKYAYFNLDSQYTVIEGEIGPLNNYDGILNIYLDGKLHDTIEVKGNEMPRKFSIPVKGVIQLRLECESYYHTLGLGDLIIK